MLSDAYLSLSLLEYVQICMTSCYKYKNESNQYQKTLIKFGISTDLGNLIENTQCGNLRIFLPVRFYVKTISVLLKPQKLPF